MKAKEILQQLKEDYARRINTLDELIKYEEDKNILARLNAKRGVYRSLYAELKQYGIK